MENVIAILQGLLDRHTSRIVAGNCLDGFGKVIYSSEEWRRLQCDCDDCKTVKKAIKKLRKEDTMTQITNSTGK